MKIRFITPAEIEMFEVSAYYENLYRIHADEVIIVAVMHQKQKPG